MNKTRVVVTGLGATTPLGGDVATTWDGLLAGRSGVSALNWDDVEDLPVRFAGQAAVEPSGTGLLSQTQLSRLDRSQQFALVAAAEAMRDAGYGYDTEDGVRVDPDRLGVVVSSGIGGLLSGLESYRNFLDNGWECVSPFTFPRQVPNSAAVQVGRRFNATAGNHALASACASSAEAVGYGIEMIRNDRADVVIVGGTEACIHPLQVAAFGAMRAMSTRNDAP
ncbi:MAG: beta-ketoacyl synthase N-terminal-like domain-containing protein, partial [Streptosporangiaceae bacterium]